MALDPIKQKKIKKYRNGIVAIILFAAFSVANVFAYAFLDQVYLFSSYLTLILIDVLLSASQSLLWVALISTLVLLAPHVICAIFARKHYGFMIAALVLVSLDTTLVAIDLVMSYSPLMLINLICHIAIIVDIIVAICNKNAVAYMKEARYLNANASKPLSTTVTPDGQTIPVLLDGDTDSLGGSACSEIEQKRQVVVSRKNSFMAAFANFEVIIDGVVVGTLKNGGTLTVLISVDAHALYVRFSNGQSELLQITSGTDDKHYVVTPVMKFSSTYIKIDEE